MKSIILFLFCALWCIISVDGRGGSGRRRRPRQNGGPLQAVPFIMNGIGNNVIMPAVDIYRHYAEHSTNAHTYPVSQDISLWIGLLTLLFSVAFMRNVRRRGVNVNLQEATIMGSVAEHLNRTVRPDQNSIGQGAGMLHQLSLEILTDLEERLPLIFGHFVPDNNHRDAIRAYLEDFRDNGANGNVPFPNNFIQNPWWLNNVVEEDNDEENEGVVNDDQGDDHKGNDNEGDEDKGNGGGNIGSENPSSSTAVE